MMDMFIMKGKNQAVLEDREVMQGSLREDLIRKAFITFRSSLYISTTTQESPSPLAASPF
jgi:hypothetical protein